MRGIEKFILFVFENGSSAQGCPAQRNWRCRYQQCYCNTTNILDYSAMGTLSTMAVTASKMGYELQRTSCMKRDICFCFSKKNTLRNRKCQRWHRNICIHFRCLQRFLQYINSGHILLPVLWKTERTETRRFCCYSVECSKYYSRGFTK